MKQKYIFIDCDGTIVPYYKPIPESALKALAEAKINGSKLFLATGRYLDELTEDILQIGFDGLILNDGQHILYGDQELFAGCFSLEEETKIVNYLEAHHLSYRLETATASYECESFPNELLEIIDIDDYNYSSLIAEENKYRKDVITINVVVNNDQYYDLALAFPQHTVYGYMQNDTTSYANINLRGISKATGIELLMEYLKFSKEDTLSIGDDYNDIVMFDFTKESACMGDGHPIAKQHATYITSSSEKDGIKEALQHFEVIE